MPGSECPALNIPMVATREHPAAWGRGRPRAAGHDRPSHVENGADRARCVADRRGILKDGRRSGKDIRDDFQRHWPPGGETLAKPSRHAVCSPPSARAPTHSRLADSFWASQDVAGGDDDDDDGDISAAQFDDDELLRDVELQDVLYTFWMLMTDRGRHKLVPFDCYAKLHVRISKTREHRATPTRRPRSLSP